MDIKTLRKATGLSQSQFAKKFEINPMNISHWERGDRKPPEYVTFMMEKILEQEKEISELRKEAENLHNA